MSKFKPGDVVRLASGGPLMTVQDDSSEASANESWVRCRWFSHNEELQETHLPESLLVSAVAPLA